MHILRCHTYDYCSLKLVMLMLWLSHAAFSSMVEGKNELSTAELCGGARIHYIFQSIFVKSLEVYAITFLKF